MVMITLNWELTVATQRSSNGVQPVELGFACTFERHWRGIIFKNTMKLL